MIKCVALMDPHGKAEFSVEEKCSQWNGLHGTHLAALFKSQAREGGGLDSGVVVERRITSSTLTSEIRC